jgi:hypothetical protein
MDFIGRIELAPREIYQNHPGDWQASKNLALAHDLLSERGI